MIQCHRKRNRYTSKIGTKTSNWGHKNTDNLMKAEHAYEEFYLRRKNCLKQKPVKKNALKQKSV